MNQSSPSRPCIIFILAQWWLSHSSLTRMHLAQHPSFPDTLASRYGPQQQKSLSRLRRPSPTESYGTTILHHCSQRRRSSAELGCRAMSQWVKPFALPTLVHSLALSRFKSNHPLQSMMGSEPSSTRVQHLLLSCLLASNHKYLTASSLVGSIS